MTLSLRQAYITAGKSQAGVAVVAGDLIIVIFANDAALEVTSCTDTSAGGTNTFAEAGSGIYCPNAKDSIRIFYAIAKLSETLTISITSASANHPSLCIHVVSGSSNNIATVLDAYAFSETPFSNGDFLSPSITTTNQNNYIITYWTDDIGSSQIWSNAGPFTLRQHLDSSTLAASCDRIVSSIGNYSDTIHATVGSSAKACVIASFKGDGGGGGTIDPPHAKNWARVFGSSFDPTQAISSTVTGRIISALMLGGTIVGTALGTLAFGGSATGLHILPTVTGTTIGSITITGSALGQCMAPVVGGSSQTLMLMGSSQGSHGVAGLSIDLLPLSGTSSGAQGVIGTTSRAISAPSGSTQASHGVAGTSSQALPLLGGSVTGNHTAGAVSGTSTAVLTPHGSSVGFHGVKGTSSSALLFTGTASGQHTAPIIGSSSQSLVLAGNATGRQGIVGTGTVTLSPISGTAIGKHGVTGSSTAALGQPSGSAVSNFTIPPVIGNGSQPLPAIRGSAVGQYLMPLLGTSSASLVFQGSVHGTHGVQGTSSDQLQITGAASGMVQGQGTTGTSLTHIPSISGTATGSHGIAGTSLASFQGPSGASNGTFTLSIVLGTSTGSMPLLRGSIQGAQGITGDSAGVIFQGGHAAAFHIQELAPAPPSRRASVPLETRIVCDARHPGLARVEHEPKIAIVPRENRITKA